MRTSALRTLGLVVGAVAALFGELVAQTLTPAQIEAAIKAGTEGREGYFAASCSAGAGGFLNTSGLSFRVTIEGPLERVAAKAREAKANFKPFSSKDVTADLLKPLLDVTVVSSAVWDGSEEKVLYPTNVVILRPAPKGQEPVGIEPTAAPKHLQFTVDTRGSDLSSQAPGLKATFRIAQLPSEFDIAVVVAQSDTRRSCHFKSKAVSKVLGIIQ